MSTSSRDQRQGGEPGAGGEVSTAPGAGNDPALRRAASVLLYRGDAVLLVERAAGVPGGGLWSAPGGHVEAGETAEQAARRELEEETGLVAGPLREVCVHEVAAGCGTRAYRITVFTGFAADDRRPIAASDAVDARFVALGRLGELAMTDGLDRVISRAARRLQGDGW
jgi:ADP-ribose pyrophosphatase YjhB (NUDIX family)